MLGSAGAIPGKCLHSQRRRNICATPEKSRSFKTEPACSDIVTVCMYRAPLKVMWLVVKTQSVEVHALLPLTPLPRQRGRLDGGVPPTLNSVLNTVTKYCY